MKIECTEREKYYIYEALQYYKDYFYNLSFIDCPVDSEEATNFQITLTKLAERFK